MCTDKELRQKIITYNNYSIQVSELEKIKKAIQAEIIAECDARGTDNFEGYKLITERLTETATKEGKQALKTLYPETIDKYISVSYSRFINGRNAKKIV